MQQHGRGWRLRGQYGSAKRLVGASIGAAEEAPPDRRNVAEELALRRCAGRGSQPGRAVSERAVGGAGLAMEALPLVAHLPSQWYEFRSAEFL